MKKQSNYHIIIVESIELFNVCYYWFCSVETGTVKNEIETHVTCVHVVFAWNEFEISSNYFINVVFCWIKNVGQWTFYPFNPPKR